MYCGLWLYCVVVLTCMIFITLLVGCTTIDTIGGRWVVLMTCSQL